MKATPFDPNKPYGQWTVIGPPAAGATGNDRYKWLCRCACGTERRVFAPDLRSGRSDNCGCVRRAKVAARNLTHGLTATREYVVWCGMIARCHNPNHKTYDRYGGRGIQVCDRWRESFEAFIADVGWPPSPSHALDRIDNSRGYEPGNVRWVTNKANANNTRRNHRLTFQGLTLTISQWADRLGTPKHTIHNRLRLGWSVEKTLSTPAAATTVEQVDS